jgi:hypothetical protein
MDELRQKLIVQSLIELASDLRHCDTIALGVCTFGLALGAALAGAASYVAKRSGSSVDYLLYSMGSVGFITFLFSFSLGLRIKSLSKSLIEIESLGEALADIPYVRMIRDRTTFGRFQIFYLYSTLLIVSFGLIMALAFVAVVHNTR